MIRVLTILLGLIGGALVALALNATPGHLTQIPNVELPRWAAQIATDATLPKGSLTTSEGRVQAAWKAKLGDDFLPVWAVSLTATGASLTADAAPLPQGVAVTLLRGSADLSESMPVLLPGPMWQDLTGEILLRGTGTAEMSWQNQKLDRAEVAARIVNLRWQDQVFGAIDIDLSMTAPVWNWQLRSLPDNPVSLSGEMRGLSGSPALQIDITIKDTPDMHDDLRRALSLAVPTVKDREQDIGWRIGQVVRLPHPLP